MLFEQVQMKTRMEIDFAMQLVEEDFGIAARQTFQVISRRANLTFADVCHLASLSRRSCGSVLLTLIKHGCVTAHTSPYRPGVRNSTMYSVDLARSVCRRRFPRYLIFTRLRYGREHFLIILAVMLHGAMRRDQIVATISRGSGLCESATLESTMPGVQLSAAFDDLVRGRYLQDSRTARGLDNSTPLNNTPPVSIERSSEKSSWQICPDAFDNALLHHILLHHTQGLGGTVCLNVHTSSRRKRHVEAVIRSRFGSLALRIFRLLSHSQLEQKQVADISMVPVKDTRDILYKLLKCGYVQMQEVARTHDHAPSRTNYLWRVDLVAVEAVVKRELVQTLMNNHLQMLRILRRRALAISPVVKHFLDGPQPRSLRNSWTYHEVSATRLDELILIFDER